MQCFIPKGYRVSPLKHKVSVSRGSQLTHVCEYTSILGPHGAWSPLANGIPALCLGGGGGGGGDVFTIIYSVLCIIQGHDLVVRHYCPPSSVSRESLFALSSANRYRWRTMERPLPVTPPPLVKAKPEASFSNTDSYNMSLASQPVMTSLASTQASAQASIRSDPLDTAPLTVTSLSEEHIITAPIIGGMVPPDRSTPSPVQHTPASPAAVEGGEEEEEEEGALLDKECFPMGSRDSTRYDMGWLDIACGPTITIDIDYSSHHHDPNTGDHTPLLPNVLRVNVDAPVALIRVFGSLARDLLGLKVSPPAMSG